MPIYYNINQPFSQGSSKTGQFKILMRNLEAWEKQKFYKRDKNYFKLSQRLTFWLGFQALHNWKKISINERKIFEDAK